MDFNFIGKLGYHYTQLPPCFIDLYSYKRVCHSKYKLNLFQNILILFPETRPPF